MPTLARVARKLRELGFLLALDDVGEGNSGLELLAALPVDFIKISRDMVSTAIERKEARAVLNAVLAFAQQTDAYVIAEGIETPLQATELAELGCAVGQGFLFAPAVPAAGLPGLIGRGGRVQVAEAWGATQAAGSAPGMLESLMDAIVPGGAP